jgi:hypothetical protein
MEGLSPPYDSRVSANSNRGRGVLTYIIIYTYIILSIFFIK